MSDEITVPAAPSYDATLEQVKDIALSDSSVRAQLAAVGPEVRFINYVLPTTWAIAEIPMNNRGSDYYPQNYDRSLYIVVFTVAEFPESIDAGGRLVACHGVEEGRVGEIGLRDVPV